MKKAKRKIRRASLRRFTPREQQHVRDLADALAKLIPATSRGDYCMERLAKKAGLGKYFNSKLGNKRKQFIYFIQQVYGRHKRKFKTIVNNLLADAVDWRRGKGEPILRAEADVLKTTLYSLGIDLRKEINELQLPLERPKITPPPIHVKQALEKFGLHPILLEKVFPLFRDGHLNEAVRKAGEIFEVTVTRLSGANGKYGRDLITHVFNPKTPIIDVVGYHKNKILNPVDEREGYMYLAMGVAHWCKNIMGHGDVDQLSSTDAAARIILISHLIEVAETQERAGKP